MGEPKRYSLSALVEAAGMSEAELGRRVGLSGSSLTKARRDGLIESAADRYACRAGLVPWLVWSDWLEDAWVECAAEDCADRFVPARKGHRYCSSRCRRRTNERAAWALNLPFVERKREYRRRYYAENGDYERRRQLEYDRRRARERVA